MPRDKPRLPYTRIRTSAHASSVQQRRAQIVKPGTEAVRTR